MQSIAKRLKVNPYSLDINLKASRMPIKCEYLQHSSLYAYKIMYLCKYLAAVAAAGRYILNVHNKMDLIYKQIHA